MGSCEDVRPQSRYHEEASLLPAQKPQGHPSPLSFQDAPLIALIALTVPITPDCSKAFSLCSRNLHIVQASARAQPRCPSAKLPCDTC